jgi:hypothetical protein
MQGGADGTTITHREADGALQVAQTVLDSIDAKVPKNGTDRLMTAAEGTKLSGIAAGAQVNAVTNVAGKTGAVTLAKADVGLGNADNTADSAKAVLSADKLTAARTITLTGAVTGSVSTDFSGDFSMMTIGALGSRKQLAAATRFYVRTTADGGDDSNDGTAATKAMLNFNSMITRLVQEYDLNRQTATIDIGAGTWTNQAWRLDTDTLLNKGAIVIQGAGVDATILSASNGTTTSRNGLMVYGPPSVYQVQVKDMTFTNCGTCLGFYYGVWGRLGNLKFGPHFASKTGVDVDCGYGSIISSLGASGALVTWTHAGGGGNAPSYLYQVYDDAIARPDYVNVVIDPAMTPTGFANVNNAELRIQAAARTVFSGTLTGKRLNLTNRARVYTAGRGEAAFPGTIASTVDLTGCIIDSPRRSRTDTTVASAIAASGTFTVPSYVVGSGSLKIYLGGVLCTLGTATGNGFYQEVGNAGATSTSIKIFEAVAIGKIITATVG